MQGLAFSAVLVSLAVSVAGYWYLARRRRLRAAIPREPAVATTAPPTDVQVQLMRPLSCPTCGGQYPPGLSFCPIDARALVQNSEWSMGTVLQVVCKACQRAFEPTTRFCPYDAQELAPAPSPVTGPLPSLPVMAGPPGGKICPRCNERFAAGESFCGRDGSELVTLN
jgi:hypothetical protein